MNTMGKHQAITLLAILFLILSIPAFAGCYYSKRGESDAVADEVDTTEDVTDIHEEPQQICRNGIVEPGEECDDGPENSNTEPNACRMDCTQARCGDGVADSAEECDAEDLDGQTCELRGMLGDGLACGADCRFDVSGCTGCGDGTCELDEDSDSCPSDCIGECGDGSCSEAEDQLGCPSDCGAVAVTAGSGHTCVLLVDGTARCWGENSSCELGDGTTIDSSTPVVVQGVTGATAISASAHLTCALVAGGAALCWGLGACWDDEWEIDVPVPVAGLTGAVSISPPCAAISDGTAWCWRPVEWSDDVPSAVEGLAGAVALAVDGANGCALLADGTVMCWGDNEHGALGDGTYSISYVAVRVLGLSGAVAVSVHAGGSTFFSPEGHICALLADGTVACWGTNDFGQLGNGTYDDSNVPVVVPGLTGAVGVSAGGCPWTTDFIRPFRPRPFTCAVMADGTASCWGTNDSGQLGDGTTLQSAVPVAVRMSSNATAIDAGTYHGCALMADGAAMCWGDNYYGQLGDGTTAGSTVPVQVAPW